MGDPSTTDEARLTAGLDELARLRGWPPGVVEELGALVRGGDETELVRMNPLAFGARHGAADQDALDLFLHAAHLGLVTMDWHLLCPACGAAVESFASLRALQRCFFCALCGLHAEANLDDYIHVSFTVSPAIRRIRFHDRESLSPEDLVWHLHFTREARFADGSRVREVMPGAVLAVARLRPGERVQVSAETVEGDVAAAELQAHTGASVVVTPAADAGDVTITFEERAIVASRPAIAPGPLTLTLENRSDAVALALVASKPREALEAPFAPVLLDPIVTGGMLLTSQTFRRLFRRETVQGSEGVGVRDVTLLFTDLKGSTALYERMGDLRAFAMVQGHFDRLGAAVGRHAGAIVKTIGDAVMAAFQRPADAVRAALDMHAQIESYNREQGGRELVLKIGVHRGPSIAVTLNDSLDFFGHTVNVAARVQGLADADEIFVTDDVYRADGVAELLARVDTQDVRLRGLQREVRVHRAVRPPP